MSRSPFFFVEKYNWKTKKYDFQHPIIKDYLNNYKSRYADLYPYNGMHDVFSIVEGHDTYFPHMRGIHNGLPENVCDEIKKEYEKSSYDFGDNETIVTPNVHWFLYSDMYIYCLEHPEVEDFDEEWEKNKPIPMKDNPIKSLMDRVDAFLEVMNEFGWQDEMSDIRIVYWIE